MNPAHWTVVIPAAGKGTRLGFDRPKILYPIAGRPILDWLVDRFDAVVRNFVFVLSPSGHDVVAEAAAKRLGQRARTVVQEIPTGMADAAEIGVSVVDTPHVAVVWGDQVALRAESVQAILTLHAGPGSPVITCPTVWRDEPYIHFERDENGNLRGVLQRREGDSMPLRGESDTGFFCFQTAPLRGLLKTMRALPEGRGASTGEFNLLPLIPFAAREGHTVITPQLLTLEETIGINSEADARHLEALWAARAAGGE